MAAHSETHEHQSHHGLGFYFGILVALLALTIITYLSARSFDVGLENAIPGIRVPLAIGIATIKAFLVVYYFMHLGEHGATNKVFFATCLFFVLLMIGLIVADAATRWKTSEPSYPAFQEMKGEW